MNSSNLVGQKGLISVIIPAYNAIQWVGRAIHSARNQTYRSIEIIVVDDGSTDGTYDYLKKNYPDITVVKKPNGGLASARNFGVNYSHGEFLAFLDSDDVMAPNKLEIQIMAVRDIPDWGLCGTGLMGIWEFFAGEEIDITKTQPLPNKIDISVLDQDSLIKGNQIIASSALVKREAFFKAGCFDESLRRVEDYDMWLKIADKWKVVLVKEKMMWYQLTPGSLSDNRIAMRWDELKVISRWQQSKPEIVLPVLKEYSISLTRKLLRAGKVNEAKEVFWGSYSGKKINFLTKVEFSTLSFICKLHTLFFSTSRKKHKR